MQQHNHWHPTWQKPEYTMSWERVKEAFRRDWQQTEHDLHMGGHELNQKVGDTFNQATGKDDIPNINDANPPRIIGELTGEWERVEPKLEYGYAARQRFGARPWDDSIESDLKTAWESEANKKETTDSWDNVKHHVRRGYDYQK